MHLDTNLTGNILDRLGAKKLRATSIVRFADHLDLDVKSPDSHWIPT
jgi:hypothetical protein